MVMKDDKNLLEKPSVAFIFCSLCAFRLTAWFSLSFRKRVHHIDIFISFAGYYFQRNGRIISLFIANIISTVTSYLFCANFTEWRYFYHPLKPTQLILLLAGIYLVPQILSLWAVALSYKKLGIHKTNHICTKRSYFLLFIHICFSYITKTITSFSIFTSFLLSKH